VQPLHRSTFANDAIKCRWEKLNLVRVYTKPKGKMPDYSAPVVLRTGKCTVEDFVSYGGSSTQIRATIPLTFSVLVLV
jgi:ribosome-interacting GTPase 1